MEVGMEVVIRGRKRDRISKAIVSLKGWINLSGWSKHLPRLSPDRQPTNEEIRKANSIVNDAMRVVREQPSEEMAAKFSSRQLRHATAARLLRHRDLTTLDVLDALSTFASNSKPPPR